MGTAIFEWAKEQERTSDRIERQSGEERAAQNGDERDGARVRVGAVVVRVGQQHRRALLRRDLARDPEQPFFRYDAHGCEPGRVGVQDAGGGGGRVGVAAADDGGDVVHDRRRVLERGLDGEVQGGGELGEDLRSDMFLEGIVRLVPQVYKSKEDCASLHSSLLVMAP